MKLLVAATPISGPQFKTRTESLILARDDVEILMIESILDPLLLCFFYCMNDIGCFTALRNGNNY